MLLEYNFAALIFCVTQMRSAHRATPFHPWQGSGEPWVAYWRLAWSSIRIFHKIEEIEYWYQIIFQVIKEIIELHTVTFNGTVASVLLH